MLFRSLNLFAEYWDRVIITSFGISLLVAIALQIMLKLTIYFEHNIGEYFQSNASFKMKLLRILSAWVILFASKLIILKVLQVVFGDALIFAGAYHGLLAFIILVVTILVSEEIVSRIYRALK